MLGKQYYQGRQYSTDYYPHLSPQVGRRTTAIRQWWEDQNSNRGAWWSWSGKTPQELSAEREEEIKKIRKRYRKPIRYAVEAIHRDRGTDRDDAQQEAEMLILSYAGLVPGRMHGCLARYKENALEVEAMLTAQLKRDLFQIFERADDKSSTHSSDWWDMHGANLDPFPDPAKKIVAGITRSGFLRSLRDEYPFLMMRFEGMTEDQMAEAEGVCRRTVDNRLAEERTRAVADPEVIEYLNPSPVVEEVAPGDPIPCAGLTNDIDSKGKPVIRTCGVLFVPGSGVDSACSLRDWLLASEARRDDEKKHWQTGVGGYSHDDPREDQPELYAYKGWGKVDHELLSEIAEARAEARQAFSHHVWEHDCSWSCTIALALFASSHQ